VSEPDRIRKRLRDLEALRRNVAGEINGLRLRLVDLGESPARRAVKPPCPSEPAYHWHRANEFHAWPLPADDPCGCRAAHASHKRTYSKRKVMAP
jgi:hypothetical protein